MLAHTAVDSLDHGARASAPGTQRFCAATGESKPVAEMIRFVLDPQGSVVPDLRHRLPGRGIWVTATRQALDSAISRRAFARGFRRDVQVTKELAETTERLLERAALDALAIARKAGRVAIGFAQVEAVLNNETVAGLIHASEAAPDGIRKLSAALNRRDDAGRIVLVESFTSPQLDLALGRANVVHAALLAGRESELFLARTARLDCFRAGPNWGAKSVEPEPRGDDLTGHNGTSDRE